MMFLKNLDLCTILRMMRPLTNMTKMKSEQGETTRVTRQRTAANPSLAIVTHDALASTNTTTSQNEEPINNNDEGNCLCDLVTLYEMLVTTLISIYAVVLSRSTLLASFISTIMLHCRLHLFLSLLIDFVACCIHYY